MHICLIHDRTYIWHTDVFVMWFPSITVVWVNVDLQRSRCQYHQWMVASDAERARSRQHPSAVTCRTSQQHHISLSNDFWHIVNGTKKIVFECRAYIRGELAWSDPTMTVFDGSFPNNFKETKLKFSHNMVIGLVVFVSNLDGDILVYSENTALFLRRRISANFTFIFTYILIITKFFSISVCFTR